MLALFAAIAVASTPLGCTYDKSAMLSLTPAAFDQDMKGGWRPLAKAKGCTPAAADLLAAYREAHWGSLTPSELHMNYWHEGQLRAEAGDNAEAIRLLMSGVGPEAGADFEDYALGTIAFLHRDREALMAATQRLEAQPEPPEWKKIQTQLRAIPGHALSWPPNLDVLQRLKRCFDRPYSEAYEGCGRP